MWVPVDLDTRSQRDPGMRSWIFLRGSTICQPKLFNGMDTVLRVPSAGTHLSTELDPVGHQGRKPEKDVANQKSGFPKDAGFSDRSPSLQTAMDTSGT